jgi:hypothetical protein
VGSDLATGYIGIRNFSISIGTPREGLVTMLAGVDGTGDSKLRVSRFGFSCDDRNDGIAILTPNM